MLVTNTQEGIGSKEREIMYHMADLKSLYPQCSKNCLDGTPEIMRVTRQLPPAHCTLKIESFPLLQETLAKTQNDKFESIEFGAGGYTWVMCVYPRGNDKENGEGYISFSIRIVEKLSVANFVNAVIRFLIYDQNRDTYMLIQDMKERRFHTLKTEWGISRALELSTFHDPSKGFLVNDCCILGAEVFVIRGDNKTASLSMIRRQTVRNHTWRVTEHKEQLFSPTFSIENRQWQLWLWQRGSGGEKGKSLSLYLWLVDASDLTAGRTLYAEFELRVRNQLKGNDHSKIVSGWYTSTKKNAGSAALLALTELDNPSKGFKVNEVVIVEVNINVIFLLKEP